MTVYLIGILLTCFSIMFGGNFIVSVYNACVVFQNKTDELRKFKFICNVIISIVTLASLYLLVLWILELQHV